MRLKASLIETRAAVRNLSTTEKFLCCVIIIINIAGYWTIPIGLKGVKLW